MNFFKFKYVIDRGILIYLIVGFQSLFKGIFGGVMTGEKMKVFCYEEV